MNDMIEGSATRLGGKAMSIAQSMAKVSNQAYRQGNINVNCTAHSMTERSAVRLGNGAVQMYMGRNLAQQLGLKAKLQIQNGEIHFVLYDRLY